MGTPFTAVLSGELEGNIDIDLGGTEPPPGNGDPQPPVEAGHPFPTPVLWKANGGNGHPEIGNGILRARVQLIGVKVVDLTIFLQPGTTTKFGGNTAFWYFQPTDFMADLEARPEAGDGCGSAFVWYGGHDNQREGACWWSKPGGTLKFGIRVTLHGKDFTSVKPAAFGDGDKMRLRLRYEIA